MPLYGIALSMLVCATACIQPEEDDPFTRGGSSVTGSSPTEDDDDEEGRSEDDEAEPADEDERSEDEADTGGEARPTDDDEAEAVDEDEAADEREAPAQGAPDARVRPAADASAPSDAGARTDAGSRDAGGAAPDEAPDDPEEEPEEPAPVAAKKLTFKVTTTTMRGRYSPRHILAVWVVDEQGKFVKTLARHARIRGRYLTGWASAAGGNTVDAVTSATLTQHGERTMTWDLTNGSRMPVPPGDYKIMLELTENDRTGVSAMVPFSTAKVGTLMPPDQPSFTKMSLVLE